jgi:glucose uptake protein GlcU
VHGNIGHALFLNPGSIAAVILAIAVLLAWRTRRVTVRVWVIAAVLGLLWSWQLFKYATGRPL